MEHEVLQFAAESKITADQEPQQSADTHTVVLHLSIACEEAGWRKKRRIDKRESSAQISDNSTTEYLEQMPYNEIKKVFLLHTNNGTWSMQRTCKGVHFNSATFNYRTYPKWSWKMGYVKLSGNKKKCIH